MKKTTNQKPFFSHFLFYLSFIFILPMMWYVIETGWYKNMKQKIADKMFYIWQENQKLPVIWQKLNEFLQLDYPIQFAGDFQHNLTNYQKALEYVWDNLKNQNFNFTIEQLKTLIKFSDFIDETKQSIVEYNSDVVLFNQSLKKWPSSVIGENLKLTPVKLVSFN